MTKTARKPIDQVNRLLKAAFGEDWYDVSGEAVSDLTIGYAEPGYGRYSGADIEPTEVVVVFGNWNPARFPRDGEPPLTKAESLPSRLGSALQELDGVEVEWSDEWTTCDSCRRAFRTQGDSYSWTMFGAYTEDGVYCADCLKGDMDTALEDYQNDSRKAVTWADASDLEEAGWTKWEPGNEQSYENGWYDGQNDDPVKITAEIRRVHPEWDQETGEEGPPIVFLIDGTGQFDIHFSAWVKLPDADDQDED